MVPPEFELEELEKNSTRAEHTKGALHVATSFCDAIAILGDTMVGGVEPVGVFNRALVVNGIPFEVADLGVITA
jgi:hypothetical protein